MKNKLATLALLASLSFNVRAEPLLPTDKAAHFGLSFAMQTVSYGYLKREGYTQLDAAILSGAGTFAAGLLWELVGSTGVSKNDILANTIGQGAAMVTIFTFDF